LQKKVLEGEKNRKGSRRYQTEEVGWERLRKWRKRLGEQSNKMGGALKNRMKGKISFTHVEGENLNTKEGEEKKGGRSEERTLL